MCHGQHPQFGYLSMHDDNLLDLHAFEQDQILSKLCGGTNSNMAPMKTNVDELIRSCSCCMLHLNLMILMWF